MWWIKWCQPCISTMREPIAPLELQGDISFVNLVIWDNLVLLLWFFCFEASHLHKIWFSEGYSLPCIQGSHFQRVQTNCPAQSSGIPKSQVETDHREVGRTMCFSGNIRRKKGNVVISLEGMWFMRLEGILWWTAYGRKLLLRSMALVNCKVSLLLNGIWSSA